MHRSVACSTGVPSAARAESSAGYWDSMTELVFDERMAAQLEAFYRRRQVRQRRAVVPEALAPEQGEAILDVGCGPGF